MTNLERRVRKLEAHPAIHEVGIPDWVIEMRERRRRRLEAEGLPYVEPEPIVLEGANNNDCAAIMRAYRARRAAQAQQAEAQRAEAQRAVAEQ